MLRDVLEDRFFWIVLWAGCLVTCIIVARSGDRFPHYSELPTLAINFTFVFVIALGISIWRALSETMGWEGTGYLDLRDLATAIHNLKHGQWVLLFIALALVTDAGKAILILLLARAFSKR